MREITINIEYLPEDVWLATSEDMPGFNVEAADKEEIFKLAQTLALDFLKVDGEIRENEEVAFKFEVQE